MTRVEIKPRENSMTENVYNEKVLELDLESRKLDIEVIMANIDQMKARTRLINAQAASIEQELN